MKNTFKRIHHFMAITTMLATLLIGCTKSWLGNPFHWPSF